MSEQLAWAAGLFEGEGCISVPRSVHTSAPYVQLQVISTDLDVLERFAGIVKAGNVRLQVEQKGNHKAQYRWTMARRNEVARILREFRPWLGERRGARCDEALAWLAEHPIRKTWRTPVQIGTGQLLEKL